MSRRVWVAAFFSYALLAFVASYKFVLSSGIVGHNWDSPIDWNFAGHIHLAQDALSAWSNSGLGADNTAVSNAFYYWIMAAAGSAKTLSVMMLLLLPAFGALTGMFLTYQVCLGIGRASPWGAWLGGVAFGFSPFFYNEMQAGSVGQLLAHAGLALVLALLVQAARKRSAILVAVAALSTIVVNASLQDFILMFPLAFILIFAYGGWRNWPQAIQFSVTAFLINAYWVIPFAHAVFALAGNATYAPFAANLANVQRAWQSFLVSGYPLPFFDIVQPYVTMSADVLLTLSFLMAVLWLSRQKSLHKVWVWVVLFFVGTATAEVANGAIAPIMLWLFAHVSLMNLFRSPQHFVIVPALAWAVIVGSGWSLALRDAPRVAVLASVVIFVLARWPFFTGDLSSAYLVAIGEGHAISLYEPSPGYRAVAKQIDASPKWSRTIFLPMTFSPLYLSSPFQARAQGGDPFVIYSSPGHGTVLGDDLPSLSSDGQEIVSDFIAGLPDSIESGVPQLFDVSQLVLRYDVLDHFGPFWQHDPNLVYRVGDYLTRRHRYWQHAGSIDMIDSYRANPPGRIYTIDRAIAIAGDASDVLDFESNYRLSGAAWSGSLPQSGDLPPPTVALEDSWDAAVDKAVAGSVSPRRAQNILAVASDGDYAVFVKRRPFTDFGPMSLFVDGTNIASPGVATSTASRFGYNGARWAEIATVRLKKGSHAFAIQSPILSTGQLVAGQGTLDASNVVAVAVAELSRVPSQQDFGYGGADASIVALPQVTEARSRLVKIDSSGLYQLRLLRYDPPADREFPAVSFWPSQSKQLPKNVFFVRSLDPSPMATPDVPLGWYVSRPEPRLAPKSMARLINGSSDYAIDSGAAGPARMSVMLTGLNGPRSASLTLGSAHTNLKLGDSSGPIDSFDGALALSAYPVTVAVSGQLRSGENSAHLDITPPITVGGKAQGIPIAVALGISLGIPPTQQRSFQLAAHSVITNARPLLLGQSTPAVAVGRLDRLELHVSPPVTTNGLYVNANAYVKCNKTERAYEVPVALDQAEGTGVIAMALSGLSALPGARSCFLTGFAYRFEHLPGFPDAGLTVLKADLFLIDPHLQDTSTIAITRASSTSSATFSGRLLPDQRILSIELPRAVAQSGGDAPLPGVTLDVDGTPIGIRGQLLPWSAVSKDTLQIHNILEASPADDDTRAMLAQNESRTTLLVAGRIVPHRDQGASQDAFWDLDGTSIRLYWPATRSIPGPGEMRIIPADWFVSEGTGARLEVDTERVVERTKPARFQLRMSGAEYADLPVHFRAYATALRPVRSFSIKLDGRPISLEPETGIPYRHMLLSRPRTISLARGNHRVFFSNDGAAGRLFLVRLSNALTGHYESVRNLQSSLSSRWSFDLPSRRTTQTLVFSESFSNGWQLGGVVGARHITVDGFANGWLLPPGPAARVTLYYSPQTAVSLGEFITVATILLSALWFLLSPRFARNRVGLF